MVGGFFWGGDLENDLLDGVSQRISSPFFFFFPRLGSWVLVGGGKEKKSNWDKLCNYLSLQMKLRYKHTGKFLGQFYLQSFESSKGNVELPFSFFFVNKVAKWKMLRID